MDLRSIAYNSVTVSLPKNVVQFALGVVIFWVVNGSFSIGIALIAMAGFLLAYSSIYFFNDITDCDEDRLNRDKKAWKLVANGMMSKRTAAAAGVTFLGAGLALSRMVNGWFFIIVSLMVLLNFLHSSPYIRLKRRLPAAAVNLTAIEFLKYSCGWFAMTSNLTSFPFWLILCFAAIYSAIYLVYKCGFKGDAIREKKALLAPLGALAAFSYLVSLVIYNYAIPMMFLLLASVLLAKVSVGKRLRFMSWLWVEFMILPLFIVAFLLLGIPTVAQANENITATICKYKQDVYHTLPDNVADDLESMEKPRYGSLDDFQQAINESMNISLVFFPPGNNK